MRYDTMVTLQVVKNQRSYDYKLGKYSDEVIEERSFHANLSTISKKRIKEMFGDVDSNVSIVRIQGVIDFTPSFIQINGVKYNILENIKTRRDTAFYITERN